MAGVICFVVLVPMALARHQRRVRRRVGAVFVVYAHRQRGAVAAHEAARVTRARRASRLRGIYARRQRSGRRSDRDRASRAATPASASCNIARKAAWSERRCARCASDAQSGAALIVNDDGAPRCVSIATACTSGPAIPVSTTFAGVRRALGGRLVGLSLRHGRGSASGRRKRRGLCRRRPGLCDGFEGGRGRADRHRRALRRSRRATTLPVAAIGGIGPARFAGVRASGVAMAAVISAMAGCDDPGAAAAELVAAWNGRVARCGDERPDGGVDRHDASVERRRDRPRPRLGSRFDARVFTAVAAVSAQDATSLHALSAVQCAGTRAVLDALPWEHARAVRVGVWRPPENVAPSRGASGPSGDSGRRRSRRRATIGAGGSRIPRRCARCATACAMLRSVVLTPNCRRPRNCSAGRDRARENRRCGASRCSAGRRAVLLKGGHLDGDPADALAGPDGDDLFLRRALAGKHARNRLRARVRARCELARGLPLIHAVHPHARSCDRRSRGR